MRKRYTINEPSLVTQLFEAYGPLPHAPGLRTEVQLGAFTAGTCSRCGASCVAQMVTMDFDAPNECEALCADCMAKDAEKRRGDWFAAEERATR